VYLIWLTVLGDDGDVLGLGFVFIFIKCHKPFNVMFLLLNEWSQLSDVWLLQYMQTFRNCIGTPQSVLQLADIDVIFHGIPELHMAHKFFVRELEPCVSNWSADQQIGQMFYTLVS